MRETISDFMEEHRVQKHKDNTVVNKVNRLKDAIEELSDGDDMDFSVAELSAYLDMSVVVFVVFLWFVGVVLSADCRRRAVTKGWYLHRNCVNWQ